VSRWIAYTWGLGGIVILIGRAVYRMSFVALEATEMLPWTAPQWVFAVLWLFFMSYTEGYRGFQKRFAPRVVARARHLADHPRWHHLLLAPAFCIGFFHGTRRLIITSWALTIGIVGIVLVVREVAQPWRGIVDLGVVVGLTWGTLAMVGHFIALLRHGSIDIDPQLPE